MKTKVAPGACRRVASSRLRVPLALTPKSVWGSRAAQSWEGWAAAWTISSSSAAFSVKARSIAGWSRMSASSQLKDSSEETRASVTCAVEADSPKKLARMSFSIPTIRQPAAASRRTASEPTRPPEPVTIAVGIGSSGRRQAERLGDALTVLDDPGVDVCHHLSCPAARAPVRQLRQPPAVGDV